MVHSRCVQVNLSHLTRDAISVLSTKSAKGEIPLVLIPSKRWSWSLWMQVPEGCACLVQKFGKDIGEQAAGLHILPSWFRIAYIISTQYVSYDAPVLTCPTKDDVRVSVDVVLVFRIERAKDFIYRLGARNFDEFLSGTVDEAIRQLVRGVDVGSAFGLRGSRSEHMLQLLNEKFEFAGVVFKDVKVTSVWLPDILFQYLELSTTMAKEMLRAKAENEYEMLQIKQSSQMEIETIQQTTHATLVTEAGNKRRAEIEFEQNHVKAEEEGRIAFIAAETSAEVMTFKINNKLECTAKQLEAERVLSISKAEAKASAEKIAGELKAEEEEIRAGWMEKKMLCEAEAVRHLMVSEIVASKSLVAKRRHELLVQEKQIMGDIAQVGKFNLIGSPGDQIVNAVISGCLEV